MGAANLKIRKFIVLSSLKRETRNINAAPIYYKECVKK